MPNFIPPVESLLKKATELFEMQFKVPPEVAACAPGRVNLIGEHTDYNDGFVLPMALPLVTIVAGRVNGTHEVNICSTTDGIDSPHNIQFFIDQELQIGKPKWANYIKGVLANFKEAKVPGFDAVIVSSVPPCSGLSSSAALEVAMYTFLETLTSKKAKSHITKAQACQKAEHLYAGVPCGIMDQLVSIYGHENKALLIDCRTLDITYTPLDDPEIAVLITNSNVKHELSESEYATRRKQCQEAANILNKKTLRDAMESDLVNLENEILLARAKHVVTENKRTLEGAQALMNRDFVKLGKLMIESHYSLRDDFQVSCKELDAIVEASLETSGVFGSRMTGGGFGGCTVTLVKKDATNQCIENIKQRFSGDPVFYVCVPSEGARSLTVAKN